jgi:hypothetical protein
MGQIVDSHGTLEQWDLEYLRSRGYGRGADIAAFWDGSYCG